MFYVKLLFWHEDRNHMANLMLAAEIHLFRLGFSFRKLDCHSQWQIKLMDGVFLASTVVYTIIGILGRFDSKFISIWCRAIFSRAPWCIGMCFWCVFLKEQMVISRRIAMLNMVLEKLLGRQWWYGVRIYSISGSFKRLCKKNKNYWWK